MSSHTPHNDVQKELEGLSPLLARMRKPKAAEEVTPVDMDKLHELGRAALDAVPVLESTAATKATSMQVVHRKRSWQGLAAAAVALMVGALISYSILSGTDSARTEVANANSALSEELMASFEEQTADPMAFLLNYELLFADQEELFFSPAEDVLLDWADDGSVEDELSKEVMIDALR